MDYFKKALVGFALLASFSANASQVLTLKEIEQLKQQQAKVDARLKSSTLRTGNVDFKREYNKNGADKDIATRMENLLKQADKGELTKHLKEAKAFGEQELANNPYLKEAQALVSQHTQVVSKTQVEALNALAESQQMEDIVEQVHAVQNQVNQQVITNDSTPKLTYFISFGMPKKVIKEVLVQASLDPNARVLVRGLQEGMSNVLEMVQFVNGYLKGMIANRDIKVLPNVELDNIEFLRHDIGTVPTMVYQQGNKTLKIEGLTSKDYVKRRFDDDKLETMRVSDTFAIAEMDIKEFYNQRILSINWKEKQQNAYKRFWRKKEFMELPTSAHEKIYYIDPTVTIHQNIPAPNGQLFGYKGQKLNPIKMIPIDMTIIVFDGTNKHQVQWAKTFTETKATGQVVLMTTKIKRKEGWKHLDSLRATFADQVFVLPGEVVQRFALKNIPSVIKPEDNLFKIHVFSRSEWENL